MKELDIGTAVESEHLQTYNWMKAYLNKHKKLPPSRSVFRKIAANHIAEDKHYYTKLGRCNL